MISRRQLAVSVMAFPMLCLVFIGCSSTPNGIDVLNRQIEQNENGSFRCFEGDMLHQVVTVNYEVSTQIADCAAENESYSEVYGQYPDACCEGLTAYPSGMDVNVSITDICYTQGHPPRGVPVGVCIKCGDGVCGDAEHPCNCPDDCTGQGKSEYDSQEAFCAAWVEQSGI